MPTTLSSQVVETPAKLVIPEIPEKLVIPNKVPKQLRVKTDEHLSPRSRPMLPPQAEKKMRCWIRSRHLICSGNFFILETVEYSTVDRFSDCVTSLGGTLISVNPSKKIWIGNRRPVILHQAKASLHTPHHNLKQYWIKYGGFYTRFDERG